MTNRAANCACRGPTDRNQRHAGGYFNPAVMIGRYAGGRCESRHVMAYIVAQVIAAVVAAAALWAVAANKPGWVSDGFASNGRREFSPDTHSLGAGFLTDVVMTFFLFVVHRHDIKGEVQQSAAAGNTPGRHAR